MTDFRREIWKMIESSPPSSSAESSFRELDEVFLQVPFRIPNCTSNSFVSLIFVSIFVIVCLSKFWTFIDADSNTNMAGRASEYEIRWGFASPRFASRWRNIVSYLNFILSFLKLGEFIIFFPYQSIVLIFVWDLDYRCWMSDQFSASLWVLSTSLFFLFSEFRTLADLPMCLDAERLTLML